MRGWPSGDEAEGCCRITLDPLFDPFFWATICDTFSGSPIPEDLD